MPCPVVVDLLRLTCVRAGLPQKVGHGVEAEGELEVDLHGAEVDAERVHGGALLVVGRDGSAALMASSSFGAADGGFTALAR